MGSPATDDGFGELLLHHRLAAGLSQRELSHRSGLSERAVRDLERGAVARPRRGSVGALAAALGLAGDEMAAFAATAARRGRPHTTGAWHPPADLVGRRAELHALVDLVTAGRHRIITVTGPAGVGKSRLAAALVAVVRRRAGPAVYTLDLSGLAEPDLVGELIAEAIGPPGSWRSAPVDRVAAELRNRRAVLVLDCFERLVDAAPVLAALVRRCPGLTVLTTSRLPLDLAGERRLPLEPLSLTDAVELFVRRAAAVAPGFVSSPDNAGAIRSICVAVDGLPLAIELAAARMRLLTPAELAARLDRPLHVLTGGSRDAPDRHRSLRAAIESSVDLVGEDARTLLAWLAPFAGGVRLADLERIVDRGWLLGALTELADAGLVRVREDGAYSRYVLPDAVWQLAAERLDARDDGAAVRQAVALWYLGRLRVAAELDAELDNLRAAVDWAQVHRPDALDTATVQALYRFYDLRGRYREGLATLVRLADAGAAGAAYALVAAANLSRLLKDAAGAERLVRRAEALLGSDRAIRAAAELSRGNLATDRGDLSAARAHNVAAERAARAAGDALTLARALNNLGGIAMVAGDLAGAERYYRESLDVRRRAGASERDLGLTLMNLAELCRTDRRWAAAIRYAREAAELLDRAGNPRLRAMALSVLALAALRDGTGDTAAAAAAMDEAAALMPAFGDDRPTRGIILARHSVVLHACGLPGDAFPALVDAVESMMDTVAQYELSAFIEAHATLLAGADPVAATRLLGLAEALRDHQDHPQPAFLQPTDRTAAACRAGLGAAEYARQHRYGADRYRHGLTDALAELFPAASVPLR